MSNGNWRVKKGDGKVYGPIDGETFRQWIKEQRVLAEDLISPEGQEEWKAAESVPEFADLFAEAEKKEVAAVPQEAAQTAPGENKCPHCGNPLAPAATFCVKCGVDLKTGQKVGTAGAEVVTAAMPEDKNLLTFQLMSDGWRAMKHKGIFAVIGAFLLMMIITAVASAIPFVNFIAVLIVAPAMILGWCAYCLGAARKEQVGIGNIFSGFSFIWIALGAYLLIGLLSGLASITIIWGIYLSLAYMLTWFFIFDNRMGPWQAMKASYDATKGYKFRIMALWSVCMLIGTLCLGIGQLVTIPIACIGTASLYQRIKTNSISEKHKKTKLLEYILALLPFILYIVLIIVAIIFGEKTSIGEGIPDGFPTTPNVY